MGHGKEEVHSDMLWRGAGMAQWWERSPPTNVAGVRFPDLASYLGWVCCWLSSLLEGFFSGFPHSTKPTFPIPVRSAIQPPQIASFKHYRNSIFIIIIIIFFVICPFMGDCAHLERFPCVSWIVLMETRHLTAHFHLVLPVRSDLAFSYAFRFLFPAFLLRPLPLASFTNVHALPSSATLRMATENCTRDFLIPDRWPSEGTGIEFAPPPGCIEVSECTRVAWRVAVFHYFSGLNPL